MEQLLVFQSIRRFATNAKICIFAVESVAEIINKILKNQ